MTQLADSPPLAQSSGKTGPDRAVLAVGMILCALCVGYAIDIRQGLFHPLAFRWLTIGAIACVLGVALPGWAAMESVLHRSLVWIAVAGVLVQLWVLLPEIQSDSRVTIGILFVAIMGFAQAAELRSMRKPLILFMAAAFCIIASIVFTTYALDPRIDVYVFQTGAATDLLHGKNPYEHVYPNIYTPDTPFYGPGVVGPDNNLTYGFPYPPLSALLTIPAQALGGDVRYSNVIAMGLSALLMGLARPGRLGGLAAVLFLLTPQSFYVLDMDWSEPLLVFTFSLTMYCACKKPTALPWALGLYFATKQYTILTLPAVVLLVPKENFRKSLTQTILKAGAVVAALTVPFFLWDPRAFWRAVVQWQLVQPFRTDALSYLVWSYDHTGVKLDIRKPPHPPLWIPFASVVPVIALALWRCARSPAGFAAAVTIINFAFFAFNKQAFCNYYFFVIATACWVLAATDSPRLPTPKIHATPTAPASST